MKAFYGETIGLSKNPDMGDDAFQAGGAIIAIDGHSETKGSAKEPQRVLIDFFVDDRVKRLPELATSLGLDKGHLPGPRRQLLPDHRIQAGGLGWWLAQLRSPVSTSSAPPQKVSSKRLRRPRFWVGRRCILSPATFVPAESPTWLMTPISAAA